MTNHIMNWKIYLLDDSTARHDLLHSKVGLAGLIGALNNEARKLDSPHSFSIGFASMAPTLDGASILNALNEPEGIWLVDLVIPQGLGVGPASAIVSSSGTGELDLAQAVMQKLQFFQRKFVIVSTGTPMRPRDFNQLLDENHAESLTFDTSEDIPGAVRSILSLIVPEQIYKRAFEEARNAFGVTSFHAAVNQGRPVAMFDTNSPLHDLSSWDSKYATEPRNELAAIQQEVSKLMTTWQLESSSLNSFRTEKWNLNWRLPSAKAINGGSIHRSFIFALSPNQVDKECTPFVRLRICDRIMNQQQPHLGILGLKMLISGEPNNGFEFSRIENCTEHDRTGLQLTLTARFNGCDGKERFEEVLTGTWQPPADTPNSAQLSRALKQVRDAFITDGSTVDCSNGQLRLLIRIAETDIR